MLISLLLKSRQKGIFISHPSNHEFMILRMKDRRAQQQNLEAMIRTLELYRTVQKDKHDITIAECLSDESGGFQ